MKVLIVCTGNTCRSPMAEGIFKSLIKKANLDIQVQSTGTFAFDGDRVSNHAVKALENLEMDISNHKSKLIHKELINDMDLILTMSSSHKETINRKFPNAKEKTFLLNEYAFGDLKDVMDPYGGSLSDYEAVRDEIYRAAVEIVKKIGKR